MKAVAIVILIAALVIALGFVWGFAFASLVERLTT